MKKILYRLTILSMISLSALSLSSCDKDAGNTMVDELTSTLVARANDNLNLAQELTDAGLLPESEMQNISKYIKDVWLTPKLSLIAEAQTSTINTITSTKVTTDSNGNDNTSTEVTTIVDDKLSGKEKDIKAFLNSVSMFNPVVWGKYDYDFDNSTYIDINGYNKSEFDSVIMSNFLQKSKYAKYIPSAKGVSSTAAVTPLNLLSEDACSTINSLFLYPIYVLKSSETIEGDGGKASVDEIYACVQEAIANPASADTTTLDKYFEVAKYDSGKVDSAGNKVMSELTLLDASKRSNQVAAVSNGTDTKYVTANNSVIKRQEESSYEVEYEIKIETDSNGNKSAKRVKKTREEKDNSTLASKYENEPGKDLVIHQAGFPVMAIRLKEFNKEAVENVKSSLGLGDNQYLVVTSGNGGRIYLMQYQVHTLLGFKETEDEAGFDSKFSSSDLGINFRTGKFLKYKVEDGKQVTNNLSGFIETTDFDNYYQIGGSTDLNKESKSSFVIIGDTKEHPVTIQGKQIVTGRVVLRDYLEVTYAPGIVDGENLVAFGRKIRVSNFSGKNKNVEVASYYDLNGNELSGSAKLYISDFADSTALVDVSEPTLKYIKGSSETRVKLSDMKSGTASSGDDKKSDNKDSVVSVSALNKIDTLRYFHANSTNLVYATVAFPGGRVAIIDKDKELVPQLYGLVVKKSIFETGLFSGWIQSTDTVSNSLTWWNDWLTSHGFEYNINKNLLGNYLTGNYQYELAKDGYMVLDIDSLGKIQEDYDAEDKVSSNHKVRTLFLILGIIIAFYGTLLLLFWVVDTSVDLGFNLLEKATLGHLVAVTDEDDLPMYDADAERKYVGFSSLLKKVLWYYMIAIMLILVNFSEIGYWLIQIFGGVAKAISQILNGR